MRIVNIDILNFLDEFEGLSLDESVDFISEKLNVERKDVSGRFMHLIDSNYLKFDQDFKIRRGDNVWPGARPASVDYYKSVHEHEVNRNTLVEHHSYEIASFKIEGFDSGDIDARVWVETDLKFQIETPDFQTLTEWLLSLFESSDNLPKIDMINYTNYRVDLHQLADRLYSEITKEYPRRNVQIELTIGNSGVFKTYRPFLNPYTNR